MRKVLAFFLSALITQFAHAQTEQLDSIYYAAQKAYDRSHFDEANSLAERYCSLCDTSIATFNYSMALSFMANYAAKSGQYDAAIRIGQRVIDVRRKVADCSPRHVATALNDEAVNYANIGDYYTAVSLCSEAIEIFRVHAYKTDPQYSVTLSNMCVFLTARGEPGDVKRAIEYGNYSLKQLKKGTLSYVNALNSLAVCYAEDENFVKADEISKELFKMGKKVYADNPLEYAGMLAGYSSRLASLRAYQQAMQYAKEAEKTFREANQTHTLIFAELLVNTAVLCTALERYDESIELLNEACPLLRTIVGEQHAEYVRCLSEYSIAYNKKGDLEKAEEFGSQLRNLAGKSDGGNQQSARVLSKQADIMAASGNYAHAVELVHNAFDVFHQNEDIQGMAETLNKLANLHILAGDYTAAVDSGLYAVRLLETHKKEPLLLADALSTVALAYFSQNIADTARVYGERSVGLYEQLGDTLSSIYAKGLANLALYNQVCGDTHQTLRLAEKAKAIQLASLGEDHPDNVSMFYNLARYYVGVDECKTQNYYHRALRLQTKVVRDNFSHQTSSERETYWNTKSFPFKIAPVMAYMHPKNDSILVDAYNAQLFTKGLLLNSEINFRTFLRQTGDSLLLQKYDRLELLRRDIDAAFNLPPAERALRTAGPLAEVSSLEKQLVKGCKQFGDFMASFDDDMHTVSGALKPDEVAIELMNLDVQGSGETYLALYLRRGWDVPRCKVLFNEYDLEQIGYNRQQLAQALNSRDGIDRIYHDEKFGQLIWGRLLPELGDDVKTLYFSPVGMFYQLGAEYLKVDSCHTVSDRFNCHRLSSTRLIARQSSGAKSYASASVFGGLEYDMDLVSILQAHEELKNFQFESDVTLSDLAMADETMMLDSLTQRGSAVYLAGTLVEAEAIGEQLMQHNIPTSMFEEKKGLEEAFKALSGKAQSIIHIATHGFAFTDAELNAQPHFSNLVQEVSTSNPLSRSGLLLSGANYVLRGGTLPEGIENGILTAREISLLDLSGADLVVLSACRTAVGEVRDDGVFGLQRGFKKAGAVTLLMSLWSVSDAATMTMMTAFYQNLMQGNSKYLAFRNAQSAVKAAGFDSPYFWASFVMLDGL